MKIRTQEEWTTAAEALPGIRSFPRGPEKENV